MFATFIDYQGYGEVDIIIYIRANLSVEMPTCLEIMVPKGSLIVNRFMQHIHCKKWLVSPESILSKLVLLLIQ